MKSSNNPALRSPMDSSRLSAKYCCSAATACFRCASGSLSAAFLPIALHVRDAQLSRLRRIDRRRRVAHQVHRLRRLREGNHLANRGLTRQQRADAIEAERQAAVWRRAVLERFEEE